MVYYRSGSILVSQWNEVDLEPWACKGVLEMWFTGNICKQSGPTYNPREGVFQNLKKERPKPGPIKRRAWSIGHSDGIPEIIFQTNDFGKKSADDKKACKIFNYVKS